MKQTPLTWEGVAWFFMGEGTVNWVISPRYDGWGLGVSARPSFVICNSDIKLIEKAEKFLRANGVAPRQFVRRSNQKWKKPIYTLLVENVAGVKKILEELSPHLVGGKKRACKMMLNSVKRYGRAKYDCSTRVFKYHNVAFSNKKLVAPRIRREHKRIVAIATVGDKINKIYRGGFVGIGGRSRYDRKYTADYFVHLWKQPNKDTEDKK